MTAASVAGLRRREHEQVRAGHAGDVGHLDQRSAGTCRPPSGSRVLPRPRGAVADACSPISVVSTSADDVGGDPRGALDRGDSVESDRSAGASAGSSTSRRRRVRRPASRIARELGRHDLDDRGGQRAGRDRELGRVARVADLRRPPRASLDHLDRRCARSPWTRRAPRPSPRRRRPSSGSSPRRRPTARSRSARRSVPASPMPIMAPATMRAWSGCSTNRYSPSMPLTILIAHADERERRARSHRDGRVVAPRGRRTSRRRRPAAEHARQHAAAVMLGGPADGVELGSRRHLRVVVGRLGGGLLDGARRARAPARPAAGGSCRGTRW